MPVDLPALRRLHKPERQIARFVRRLDADLISASAGTGCRRLLVDTTVYIHELASKLPPQATRLLDGALHFHSAFCIAEIVSGLGHIHPNGPHFDPAWMHYQTLFSSVPDNRLLTPDAKVLVQAALVSGILARTQNYAGQQRKALFNDTVIYLTAAKLGIPLLTANRGDHDLIQQAVGFGAFIYYFALEA